MAYFLAIFGLLVTIHAIGLYFMLKSDKKYEDELKEYIDDVVDSKVGNKDKEKDDGREDN